VASLVVVFALLASVGVWNVVTARHSRAEGRQPVASDSPTASSTLLVTHSISVEQGDLTLVVVANRESIAPPPGVDQLPAPGEMVLSPAARQTRQGSLGEILHYRDIGTVSDAGLVAPDELIAYIGVDASAFPSGSDLPSRAVSGFGEEITNDLLRPDLVGFYRAFGALILLVGFGSVVRGAVRVSESLQQRRLRSLGAMGLTRPQLRFVSGTRAAVWSVVGSAAAVAIFHLIATTASEVPFTSWSYFRTDLGVGGYLSGVALVGTPLVAALISALPAGRHLGEARERSVWRLLLVPVAALVMWAVVLLPSGNSQRLAWWAAGLLILVALGFGTSEFIFTAGTLLGSRAEPTTRLAGRRLASRPGAYARLFGPIGLLLLISASAVPIAEATGARNTQLWLDTLESNGRRIVAVDTDAEIDFDASYVQAAFVTLATREAGEPAGPKVIVADCQQLLAVRVDTDTECPTGPALVTNAAGTSAFETGDVTVQRTGGGQTISIPTPTQTIAISAHTLEQLEGRIVVPPELLGAPVDEFDRAGYLVVTEPDPESLRSLEADVAAASPTASITSEFDLQIGQTRSLVPVSVGVRVATGVLIVLLLISTSVAIMSEGLTSGRLQAPLKALGVPDSFASRTYYYEIAVPAAITWLTAIFSTALTVYSLTEVWTAPTTPNSTILILCLSAGLAMVATGLTGLPFLHSPLRSETLNTD